MTEVLDQVVGEGVVVVDDQQHGRTICPRRGSVKERRLRVNKCGRRVKRRRDRARARVRVRREQDDALTTNVCGLAQHTRE